MDLKEIKPNNTTQNNPIVNRGPPMGFFNNNPNIPQTIKPEPKTKNEEEKPIFNSIIVPSSSTQPPLQSIPPSSDVTFIIPRPASLFNQARPQVEQKKPIIQQKESNIKGKSPTIPSKIIKPKEEDVEEQNEDTLEEQDQEYFSPEEYGNQVAVKPKNNTEKNKSKMPKHDNKVQKEKINVSKAKISNKETIEPQEKEELIENNSGSTPALYTVDPVMGEMTAALNLLKQDLGSIIDKKTIKKKNLKEETIQNRENNIPTSINEILDKISTIDPNIEASALVANDGTIVASAISRRINDALISTIVNSLGLISIDVIHSLDGGDLEFLTLSGTKGTLFLSPIMKNIFLILYTNPDVKMGIVSLTKTMVKKQIELFFAKKNLQKTPV